MNLHSIFRIMDNNELEFEPLEVHSIDALTLFGEHIPNHDYKRDDGLDEIVNQLEDDGRMCPVDCVDHALMSADSKRHFECHSDSLWQQYAAH